MPEMRESHAGGHRLAGRCALVTGAAGGIGRAIALRLGAEGARVLASDIDGPGLAETARQLADSGIEAAVRAADLGDPSARDELVPDVLGRWDRLDILVNNATFLGSRTPFLESREDDWQKVFAVNVMAAAALCRAAARNMTARGAGSIVNIGSIQARLPVAAHAAYVASKGAIEAMTRALAAELSASGVRVNTLAPGVVATEAVETTLSQNLAGERPEPATLMRRAGAAGEVAAAAAFLASDDASFITGACVPVDGGRSISRRPDPFDIAFGNSTETGKS